MCCLDRKNCQFSADQNGFLILTAIVTVYYGRDPFEVEIAIGSEEVVIKSNFVVRK